MYNIDDEVMIVDNNEVIKVTIIKINLDGTFIVKTEYNEELRIYREDINNY
jgi:hypothetical protein